MTFGRQHVRRAPLRHEHFSSRGSQGIPMTNTSTNTKLDELHELIHDIEIAMLTTRRADGQLVSRPMATQKQNPIADLWFVTSIDTHKVDELEAEPNVNLSYLDGGSMEWVSVSGTASINRDRALISALYQPDWKAWFGDEGGARDGGPDDPRLALILIEASSAHYMKAKHSKPRVLFELVKGDGDGRQAGCWPGGAAFGVGDQVGIGRCTTLHPWRTRRIGSTVAGDLRVSTGGLSTGGGGHGKGHRNRRRLLQEQG